MKNLKWMFFAILITGMAASCDIDDDGFFNCEKGTGNVVTDELFVQNFTGIRVSCDIEVFVTQGDTFEIIVEGQQNIIDLIETDVQGGIWDIEFDGCVKDYDDVKIWITMPDIDHLKVSGSGSIVGENAFDVTAIDVLISGSGRMNIEMTAEDIDAKISGSGRMLLKGSTEKMNLKISGSGDFRAFDLISEFYDIDISGSGDAEVTANQYMGVNISGSGDVYYKGNPTIDVSISGSGQVVNAN